MYKPLIALATAASLSLLAGPLSAAGDSAQKSQGKQGQNAEYGAAQQGTIETQVEPGFEPNFERLDANQDGKLDEAELNAYGTTAAGESSSPSAASGSQQSGQQMMQRYDQNQDGAISERELEEGYQADQQKSGASESGTIQ